MAVVLRTIRKAVEEGLAGKVQIENIRAEGN